MTHLESGANKNYKVLLSDIKISLKAKALLIYCLIHSDDENFDIHNLYNIFKEGRESIASAFKELIKYGYHQRIRTKIGHPTKYVFHEISMIKEDENNA